MNICLYNISKEGHHENNAGTLSKVLNADIITDSWKQWINLLAYDKIIFLRGDREHIKFFPFVLLRSFLNKDSYFFVYQSNKFLSMRFKHKIKTLLYYFFRKLFRVYLISSGKDDKKLEMSGLFDYFIYDPQFWDLSWLNITPIKPQEIKKFRKNKNNTKMLILGSLNEQRCRYELLSFIKNCNVNCNFIFAGKINKVDVKYLENFDNCFLINRYITDGELLYLYEYCDIIYCYYYDDFQRPSGIFGRALQLNKTILLKRGSYLDKMYIYSNKFSISRLSDLNKINIDNLDNFYKYKLGKNYDSSVEFKNIFIDQNKEEN